MIYTKPAIPLAQQIETLRQRGLVIDNEAEALWALETISYFLLADYWFAMEADHRTHTFLPDSHFDEVMRCYYFDKDLKALLFKAVQTIEVTVRSKVIKHIAPTCGPFWFMDETKAVNRHRFEQNLETIRKDVGRSRERYIREHFRKYTEPDLPPVWKTLEVVSLGVLSKLFNNFSESELKHLVARDFGLNHHRFLASWLESLTAMRNYCAHHARVWNRYYPLRPAMPREMPGRWITDFSFPLDSTYPQLCAVCYWLNSINPQNTFVGDLKLILLRYPTVDIAAMGFPFIGSRNRCGSNTPLLLSSLDIGHDMIPRTAVGVAGDGTLHETLVVSWLLPFARLRLATALAGVSFVLCLILFCFCYNC